MAYELPHPFGACHPTKAQAYEAAPLNFLPGRFCFCFRFCATIGARTVPKRPRIAAFSQVR